MDSLPPELQIIYKLPIGKAEDINLNDSNYQYHLIFYFVK